MSNLDYYGQGKLLITGEYAVLHGAEALAVPLKVGQHFSIKKSRGADLHWKSYLPDGNLWFKQQFSLLDFTPQDDQHPEMSGMITKILTAITRQNPDFLSDWKGQTLESRLEFQPDWGLGTSSTLIYALAEWAEVDPWLLLEHTFGGSGYDLACADADGPIRFQSTEDEIKITPLELEWPFKEQLHLVWSGQKQSSRKAIEGPGQAFRKAKSELKTISRLTTEIIEAKDLDTFIALMKQHNDLVAKVTGQEVYPVLKGFKPLIKPLGAWGGDFFLVASREDPKVIRKNLEEAGYATIFGWEELVKED